MTPEFANGLTVNSAGHIIVIMPPARITIELTPAELRTFAQLINACADAIENGETGAPLAGRLALIHADTGCGHA